ncbi:MAG TPA: FAD-dependent oxidoreductase, partial [Longimicrobiales bacterium]|nr:FAD-dependent oxidoreductase [Longimicrobiales bacterium]
GLLVPSPGRDALWRGGRIHQVSYGSITSMATSGALPARLKLRMGLRYVPFLERHAGSLDLNEPARSAGAGLDDESIASWGHRQMGRDFVELLAYPLLASYYGVLPEETSAGFFHALARAGMGVDVVAVRGGVGALPEAMAAGLADRGVEFRFGASVTGVSVTREAAVLELAGERAEHEAVVVAVPPSAAADLLPDATLPPVRVRPTASVLLAMEGRFSTGWFGLSIPRSELQDSSLAAVCVQSEKAAGLGEAARDTVVLVPAPRRAESWANGSPQEVLADAMATLDRVLPGARDRVAEARRVRLAGGVIPYPGYLGELARWESGTLPSRLALAGDYLVAPTVEGAVRSGVAAAERVSPPPSEARIP